MNSNYRVRSNRSEKIKKMTGVAILSAVTVVLALISNYVTIGTVNINLALIPIVIGACLFGPSAGFFLGCIDGILICTAPSTMLFITHNAFVTIILCLLKTGLGGLVSGYIYKLLKNKNDLVAVIIASLVLPIVNTGLFLIGVFAFFIPVYVNLANSDVNVIKFILTMTLSINFLIEFCVNLVLSPTIHRIIINLKK